MTRFNPFSLLALFLSVLALSACSHLVADRMALPSSHPEALSPGRPVCSDCHDNPKMRGALKPYGAFDHSAVFVKNHRFPAERDLRVCAVCHQDSFCNDCHGNKVPMKPSLVKGDRPDRELIHRGDFLSRHKIEGKVDPVSCYRCHGRTNNEKCVSCHR